MRRELMLVTGIEYMCRFKYDVARVCYLGLPSRDNVEYLFILFINVKNLNSLNMVLEAKSHV